jgi:hypothetical protein
MIAGEVGGEVDGAGRLPTPPFILTKEMTLDLGMVAWAWLRGRYRAADEMSALLMGFDREVAQAFFRETLRRCR